mgnify:CR=1 FL=1
MSAHFWAPTAPQIAPCAVGVHRGPVLWAVRLRLGARPRGPSSGPRLAASGLHAQADEVFIGFFAERMGEAVARIELARIFISTQAWNAALSQIHLAEAADTTHDEAEREGEHEEARDEVEEGEDDRDQAVLREALAEPPEQQREEDGDRQAGRHSSRVPARIARTRSAPWRRLPRR